MRGKIKKNPRKSAMMSGDWIIFWSQIILITAPHGQGGQNDRWVVHCRTLSYRQSSG